MLSNNTSSSSKMLDKQNLRITSSMMLLAVAAAAADDDEEGEHDNVKDAANNKQQDKNLVTALRMKIEQGKMRSSTGCQCEVESLLFMIHALCSLYFAYWWVLV